MPRHSTARSNRGRRMFLLISAAFAVAALLASCSSSDNNSSKSSSSSSSTGGDRVATVGVIAPVDGGLTSFGHDIRNAAQLAVDQANQRNAVPGWKIQLRVMDDSSDAAKGEAAANTLAADPTVIGVVGTYNSGVAAKAAPVLDRAGIVMISPGNTDPSLTLGADVNNPQRPYTHYFRMVAADNVQGPFLASQAMTNLHVTKAAVISETKPVSKGLADTFASSFTSDGGTVVDREVVPDGTSDFTDVVNTIKPLNPDVIFFGGEYQVAASLRNQATDGGVSAPLMGGDGIKDDAYIAATGTKSSGDYASSIGQPVGSSQTAAAFVSEYNAAGFSEKPGDFGPYAYDAANVIISAAAQALASATTVTPAARDAIRTAVQNTNTTGASGAVSFDANGDTQSKVLTLYKVENGAWVAITTATV